MKEGIFVIKRIYKDFIIAFLNSRGWNTFYFFEGAVKGRNTVKSTFYPVLRFPLGLAGFSPRRYLPSAYRGKRPKSSACKLP